jgi:hypothetical protein
VEGFGEINDNVAPSKDYGITIKLKEVPSIATRSISQSIKPNAVDRFLLTVVSKEVDEASHHYVVVADLVLDYNKTHQLDCGTLVFLMESQAVGSYDDPADWEEAEKREHLDTIFSIRHVLQEASEYGGIVNPRLQELAERISKAPPTPASWKPLNR